MTSVNTHDSLRRTLSVMSWRLSRFNPRMRTEAEQSTSERIYKKCCGKMCERGTGASTHPLPLSSSFSSSSLAHARTVLPYEHDLVDRVQDLASQDVMHYYFAQSCQARTYAATLGDLDSDVAKLPKQP